MEKRKNWLAGKKKELIILVVSLIFCLVAFEIILNLIHLKIQGNSDAWWMEEWLERKDNWDSTNATCGVDKPHPLLGWTVKENLSLYCTDWWPTRPVHVNSNSKGIRGTKEYYFEKGEKQRILALGDSFTFGYCVSDNETYPAYLEKAYAGSEVINMGVNGYGTDQELLKFELEGVKYNPDITILGFYDDDIERNMLTFRLFPKPKMSLKDNELVVAYPTIRSQEELNSQIHLKTLNIIRMAESKLSEESLLEENQKLSHRILERLVEDIRMINSTPVFVYLPYELLLYGNPNQNPLFNQTCLEQNITCIDPTEKIRQFLYDKGIKSQDELVKYFECRYPAEINELIAEEIYSALFNGTNT